MTPGEAEMMPVPETMPAPEMVPVPEMTSAPGATPAPESAWALESTVLGAAMVARRLPWSDAAARALGLDLLSPEGVTRSLLEHLRRARSGRPVRVRTPFGEFLVPLNPAVCEALLVRAGEEGALEPAAGLTAAGRRYGLSPHTELTSEVAAADGGLPALVARDVDEAVAGRRGDGTLEWQGWYEVMARLSRRLVAGEAAAEDTLLSAIVARSAAAENRAARADLTAALRRRTARYLEGPDPASLAGRLVAAGTCPDTAVAALAHALSLVSEAATATVLQALALHALDPAAAPEEAVARALRHYPPVAASVHRVRAPFVWEGLGIAAGTEILCAPGWLPPPKEGDGPGIWPSALCGAPGGCAATRLAVLVAEELVRGITAAARPFVVSPHLTAGRLPGRLDPRSLLVALAELPGGPGDGRVTVGSPSAVPVPVRGCAPGAYGALARASAERLAAHAESLAACAGADGWDRDEAGEDFRMILLDHAERCAHAADGVGRAARRLVD
ncbi:hypothetical protein [Streptomyces sp. NBC_01264]|uniref:hypothetical protein n=1 Tax=Streptomyces sp. NBC_01264 TaxID=2903804 RepID=UPI00225BFBE5|nr:hypothetical protein [Streptomyces sp. NBC_01264]MCX4775840.1 hypothetical protein [Streptomyces sp. NBC_01264]